MVLRLTVAYRGTAYAGWQRQENAVTVQQVVEEALSDLGGSPVRIHGAGRTDAGVHARGQVAHLVTPVELPLRALIHGTNHRLPTDVRVMEAARMPDGFHARKHALAKRYRYRLFDGRVVPPLEADQVVAAPPDLDLDRVRRALAVLPGNHDFTAFATAGGSHRQPVRRLLAASLECHGPELHMVFTGRGFLRGMVRGLVGTVLEVGRGRRSVAALGALLLGRPRTEAGPNAPARGLSLERVMYPSAWHPHARALGGSTDSMW